MGPDHRGSLKQSPVGGGEAIESRGEHLLHRRRNLQASDRPHQSVVAALTSRVPVSTSARTLSSRKSGFPSVHSTRAARRDAKASFLPRRLVDQFVRALDRQRIDAELGVGGLPGPWMLMLGAKRRQQQDALLGEPSHERLEHRLRFGVDPVRILHDDEKRLAPAKQ